MANVILVKNPDGDIIAAILVAVPELLPSYVSRIFKHYPDASCDSMETVSIGDFEEYDV